MEAEVKEPSWTHKHILLIITSVVVAVIFYVWSAMPVYALMVSFGLKGTVWMDLLGYFYWPVYELNNHWPWLNNYMHQQFIWYLSWVS